MVGQVVVCWPFVMADDDGWIFVARVPNRSGERHFLFPIR